MKGFEVGSLKEVLTTHQKYQRFLPYLGLALVVLFTFSVLRSGWERIGQLQESNRKEEEKVSLLRERVSQIESMSITEIEDRISDAVFALPRVKDPVLILSSAKMLAIESNLLIEEITFSPGEIRKEETGKAAKLETIDLSFSLQGSEEDIRLFVEKAGQRSPLISLTGVSFEFGQEGGMVLAKVTADTFVAPVDTSKFSKKAEITLQPKEDLVYQQVKSLEKTGTSPIAEGAEFVAFDEDRDPFIYGSSDSSLLFQEE
jgi:hypothetical protein